MSLSLDFIHKIECNSKKIHTNHTMYQKNIHADHGAKWLCFSIIPYLIISWEKLLAAIKTVNNFPCKLNILELMLWNGGLNAISFKILFFGFQKLREWNCSNSNINLNNDFVKTAFYKSIKNLFLKKVSTWTVNTLYDWHLHDFFSKFKKKSKMIST